MADGALDDDNDNDNNEPAQQFQELVDEGCHVALTSAPLCPQQVMDRVRSPEAGAVVLFAGTTRNNVSGTPVSLLTYTAYTPLALRTMLSISRSLRARHDLIAIALVHRLGVVPIGQESILVAVSAAHRGPAWDAAREALELCKARLEVWKREVLDGEGRGEGEVEGEERGVWRANRDRDATGAEVSIPKHSQA